jgi:hypothetical protein
MEKTARIIDGISLVFICLLNFQSFAHSVLEWRVPFKLDRHKIILPVRINDSRPLKIILDTGKPTRGLTLFKKKLAARLNLEGTKTVKVRGAGRGEGTSAAVAEGVTLSLGSLDFRNERAVILKKNPMHEMDVDGVIGYTLFGDYAVQIDYEEQIVTLMLSQDFKAETGWEALPLTFNEKNIPFVEASISVRGEELIPVSTYIDLGSSEALVLLVDSEMKFELPRNLWGRYVGMGMNGYMFGKFGYIVALKIGSHLLRDIPTAFPKAAMRSRQEGADGILGNQALMRFNVIFDYRRALLYLKPNRFFEKQFYKD